MSIIDIRFAEKKDVDDIVTFNACMAKETENIDLDINRLKTDVREVLKDSAKAFSI